MSARDGAYRDHPLRAYTVEEAADILSCEPGWLEELARERKVPYTELSDTCHFTSTHLAAIESAFEVLPPAGEPSQAAASPPPAELAHAADQAAAIIGGSCKGSWLKEQARSRKIPSTRIGGAYHFTDEQLAEILRIFEVPAPKRTAGAAYLACAVRHAACSSGRCLAAAQGTAQAAESVSHFGPVKCAWALGSLIAPLSFVQVA